MSSENEGDEVPSEGRNPEPKASSDEKEEEQWDPNPTEEEQEEEQWDPNPTEEEQEEEQWDPNPTEEQQEEEQWDPNPSEGEEEEEEQWDPNPSEGEEEEEEQWDPNPSEGEEEEEEQWDPNPPEGVEEEEQWDPNPSEEIEEEQQLDPSEGNLNENNNLSNHDAVTIVVPEEQSHHPDVKQGHEIESEGSNEEYPNKPEFITEEALDIMRGLEEAEIPIEDHLNAEMEYKNESEQEPELTSEQESKSELEKELEQESESKIEKFIEEHAQDALDIYRELEKLGIPVNFVSEDSEHKSEIIPEQSLELMSEQDLYLISEQKSEIILEQEPDLKSEQKPEVISEQEPVLKSKQKHEATLEEEPDLISEQKSEKIPKQNQQTIVNHNQQIQRKNQIKETVPEKKQDLKEIYKQIPGRRPIYAGKETKGFIAWKEKKEILAEKDKKTTELAKEVREVKEEWSQYLANNIEESDTSDDIKEKLSNVLEIYGILKELIEKKKEKEISEEEFKQEVQKYEYLLIEENHLTKQLFMNFDWFRRYYNEMIRKSGKRVANLYIPKKTREFLSHISGRIERLENGGNLYESAEKFEEFLEKSFQIREKWAILLNNLIHEVPNKEISKEAKRELEVVIKRYCEIGAILFNNEISKADKEKLIQRRIEKCNPRHFELFEILKSFLGIYRYYSRNWMEQSLILDGKKKSQSVHALICRAFFGNKPTHCDCTRHLDGNKLNNIPGNLRWGTYYQNEADKRRHGRVACGEKQGSAKLTESIVLLLRYAIPKGLWNEDDAAKALNMKPRSIQAVVNGKSWKHLL